MNHSDDLNPNPHPFSDKPPFSQPVVVLHVTCMLLAFAICFPFAIVQAIRKNIRTHMLLVFTGTTFAVFGFLFGYTIDLSPEKVPPTSDTTTNYTVPMPFFPSHSSSSSAHSQFAVVMLLLLATQVACGLYNRLGEMAGNTLSSIGFLGSLAPARSQEVWWRRVPPVVHAWLGRSFLLLGYVQIVLGMIVATESCPDGMFSQCAAHISMGSSFLWYGTFSLLHLLGIFRLPRTSTLEHYESLLITFWGIINTFAFHHWGTPWSPQDLQSASLGVLWWTGGFLSLAVSWQRCFPLLRERNVVPALLIGLMGLAMGGQTQQNPYSAGVHWMFGVMLMGGAAARVVQVVLRPPVGPGGKRVVSATEDDGEGSQTTEQDPLDSRRYYYQHHHHTPPPTPNASHMLATVAGFLSSLFVLSAGILYMAASQEWLNIVSYYLPDPVTYINFLIALAFLWTLSVILLASFVQSPIPQLSPPSPSTTFLPPATRSGYTKAHLSDIDDLPLDDIYAAHGRRPSSASTRTLTSPSSPGPMLPSEYRAKRRSLFASSPIPPGGVQVGGVLPDPTRPWLVESNRGSTSASASASASGSAASGSTRGSWVQNTVWNNRGSVVSGAGVFSAEPGIVEGESDDEEEEEEEEGGDEEGGEEGVRERAERIWREREWARERLDGGKGEVMFDLDAVEGSDEEVEL